MLFSIGLVVVLVVAVGWVIVSFNRFVRQRQFIDNSWANVETELLRRHDLIPNLVATVSGYATHEQQTLTAVIVARADAHAATGGPEAHEAAENHLAKGVRTLLALAERYPELRADGQFLDLQRQLTVTEDRIQASRRIFNGNVRDYNQRVESVPSNVVARVARFERATYFELDEAVARTAPSVTAPS